MSTTAQLCKCLVIGASLMALSGSGLAYNESGHLESVRLLLRQEGPLQNLNAAEKSVVAACAQLPDLSRELDAIVTYRNALVDSPSSWPSWAWWNTPSTPAYQGMFAVQQLLHGLTGGDVRQMRDIARSVVKQASDLVVAPTQKDQRFNALCVTGLALHLMGDTLGHTQLTWGSDNGNDVTHARMYPTGRGHLADLHFPDDVLCNRLTKSHGTTDCHQTVEPGDGRRYASWIAYWNGAGTKALNAESWDGRYAWNKSSPQDWATFQTAIRKFWNADAKPDDPDETDWILSTWMQQFIAGGEQEEEANAKNDPLSTGDPASLTLHQMISEVHNQSVWSTATQGGKFSCSTVLDAIRKLSGVDSIAGSGKPECSAIWADYADIAANTFAACVAFADHPNADEKSFALGKDGSQGSHLRLCREVRKNSGHGGITYAVDKSWLEYYRPDEHAEIPVFAFAKAISIK